MVHPSSNKTPNDINEDIFICGKMCIYLAFLRRPGSWIVTMCEDSIVIPSVIIAIISVEILTGAILVVTFFARFIFVPEYAIASIF